jgi:hypothetical protein
MRGGLFRTVRSLCITWHCVSLTIDHTIVFYCVNQAVWLVCSAVLCCVEQVK